jgi:hypothetical protein
MVEDITRDCGVESLDGGRIEERLALEPGSVAKTGAAGSGSVDHFFGKINPDDPVSRFEKRQADQARAASGVEDERIGFEIRLEHQPSQGRGIGLHGCSFELGRLSVEGKGKFPIMLRLLSFGHKIRLDF